MVEAFTWTQFGLAGIIAVSLGGVISYVFRLFVRVQGDQVSRAVNERDDANNENVRLHNRIEDQQRATLATLVDVARVMSEVQQMLREREIHLAMEREFDRRKGAGDDASS